MNEQEQYALAIAEGTFNGSFEEFIASNVNGGGDNAGSGNAGSGNAGGGNDGGGNSTQTTTDEAKARAERDNTEKAKSASKSTKTTNTQTSQSTKTTNTQTSQSTDKVSVGTKIKRLSKTQELEQWNAKYTKFSAAELQKEQQRLRKLGLDNELTKFVNGLFNKATTEENAAQEAKFKALAEKQAAQDASTKADANAKIIAAELALIRAKEEKNVLATSQAAEEVAAEKKKAEEAKRKAAELVGLTEAQRIRNRRIKRLLSQGIVARNGYLIKSAKERERFLENEMDRRDIERRRRIAIDALIGDEPQTKLDFDEYIATLQSEFDLLMQSEYPWFTRNVITTPKEKEDLKIANQANLERLKNSREARRAKYRKALDYEVIRKSAETNLTYNTLRDDEQQDIFEDTVNDGITASDEENSDSNSMTDIEKTKQSINDLERKLGRAIVPHRDIIESADSDFDSDSQLNPGDILIRDVVETDSGLTEERQFELLELKESMESDEVDGLYITKKIAESKMRDALDAVETQLINLNNNNIENNNR